MLMPAVFRHSNLFLSDFMRVCITIDKQKLPRMCLPSSQIEFQIGKYGRSTGSTDLRQLNARGVGKVMSSQSPKVRCQVIMGPIILLRYRIRTMFLEHLKNNNPLSMHWQPKAGISQPSRCRLSNPGPWGYSEVGLCQHPVSQLSSRHQSPWAQA